MNKFPLWKNLLLVLGIVLGIIYAMPNLYGDNPSLQISSAAGHPVNLIEQQLKAEFKKDAIPYLSFHVARNILTIRFDSTDVQLRARALAKKIVKDNYTVALNMQASTPKWLRDVGAAPMSYGLDLRGGLNFLLEVDVNSVIAKTQNDSVRNMGSDLREARIRYAGINRQPDNSILLSFRKEADLDAAYNLINNKLPQFELQKIDKANHFQLVARLTPASLQRLREQTLDQTATILRNRVNELGVSDAVVQKQGLNRISVDLPGVQDASRANRILGGTSTIELHMVDETHDARSVIGGITPPGTTLYHMRDGTPILLKNQVVLSGKSITSAVANFSQQDGTPQVAITASGSDVSLFSRVTSQNIGKRMGIVFIETKTKRHKVAGKVILTHKKIMTVISAPVIQDALGNNFVINNMGSMQQARSLALLLRAGALPAPMSILESRLVGPSMGKENIHKGVVSIEVGLILVVIFMALYYHLFGLFADIALTLNLVFLIAILSLLGATLTLPGIAGILLTLGMAVDANVLINERIREELRSGTSIQAAIHAGYSKAFITIVDANLTTLIVGIVLYGIGSGPVKGFAVTLTIGLMTSMLTGVTYTRLMVNWVYGNRNVKHLSIGM